MDNQLKIIYSVEYEMSDFVFYKTVSAYNFDDAKRQIRKQYPDVHIRAVSIIDNSHDEEQKEQHETE